MCTLRLNFGEAKLPFQISVDNDCICCTFTHTHTHTCTHAPIHASMHAHNHSGPCAMAGFIECCNSTTDDCRAVEDNQIICLCEALCFAAGDCCSDVVAISCQPGIQLYTCYLIVTYTILHCTCNEKKTAILC